MSTRPVKAGPSTNRANAKTLPSSRNRSQATDAEERIRAHANPGRRHLVPRKPRDQGGREYQDDRTEAIFLYTGGQQVYARNEHGQPYFAHEFYARGLDDLTPVPGGDRPAEGPALRGVSPGLLSARRGTDHQRGAPLEPERRARRRRWSVLKTTAEWTSTRDRLGPLERREDPGLRLGGPVLLRSAARLRGPRVRRPDFRDDVQLRSHRCRPGGGSHRSSRCGRVPEFDAPAGRCRNQGCQPGRLHGRRRAPPLPEPLGWREGNLPPARPHDRGPLRSGLQQPRDRFQRLRLRQSGIRRALRSRRSSNLQPAGFSLRSVFRHRCGHAAGPAAVSRARACGAIPGRQQALAPGLLRLLLSARKLRRARERPGQTDPGINSTSTTRSSLATTTAAFRSIGRTARDSTRPTHSLSGPSSDCRPTSSRAGRSTGWEP